MLKLCPENIAVPLQIICNKSLLQCKYPTSWKIAHVIVIFKKGDKSLPSNYRPISLIRDRTFNLQGWLWFFVSFRKKFLDNTRVRILIYFVAQSTNFFIPEFNIRLYDKTLNQIFFPPPKSEYFFQQHWESEYYFRKKT
jgi:hypothetical protein